MRAGLGIDGIGIGGVGVIRARNVLLPMGHKSSRAGHGKAALATMHGALDEGLGWGGQNDGKSQ